jgi:hypothetical protein
MRRERNHPVPVSTPAHSLASVRRALEGWRKARGRPRRIPEGLWQAVVEVAHEHGVSKTSRELGLDYYALQGRLRSNPRPKATREAFVELRWPARATAPECRLELEDGRGARLRVELTGSAAVGLEALARALWSGAA